MKYPTVLTVLAAALLSATGATAQSGLPDNGPGGRISFGYRAAFNVTVDFKNLGGFGPGIAPPSAGVTNRVYDDGFAGPDSSGSLEGTTWFWGYDHGTGDPLNQLINDGTPAGQVVMHRTYAPANVASRDRGDDPQHGLEVTYNYEWPAARIGGFLGYEVAFNYMDLSVEDARPLTGGLMTINDAYAYAPGNEHAPLAPYAGPFGGPGAIINAVPTRTETPAVGSTSITGRRSVDGSIYGFRLGPSWRFPLSPDVWFSFSGGLALAQARTRFEFQETITIPGLGTSTASGSDTKNELLVGGYVAGNAWVRLNETCGLFAGVQFQSLGSYTHRSGVRTATVNLDQTIFVTGGLNFSF